MLKVEDCRPGTEIICIHRFTRSNRPIFGHVYTVQELIKANNIFKWDDTIFKNNPENVLILAEFKEDIRSDAFGFKLSHFKLIDPKTTQMFYDLLSKPVDEKAKDENIRVKKKEVV